METQTATVQTDDYGRVPYRLYKKMKRLNLSPADWDDITDAYELVAETEVDFAQAERFIDCNTTGGMYQPPWPLNPLDIVTK